MKKGIKIALIVSVLVIIVAVIGGVIYFNFFNKSVYRITGLGSTTDYKVSDFTDKSTLEFFDNDTFHVHIEHKEKGISLIGIGTYTLKNKTYQLTFTQIYARDTDNQIIDITDQPACAAITCQRSGNRIKFTDHKAQIYYFG